jgi:hypothetical protein
MPKGNTLSRLAIASLAAAALAAPAASASAPAQQMDMHASTVHKPEPAKVDLRGEAAAEPKAKPAKVDRRGEAAADAARPPVSRGPLPGPPTWPAYPTPLPTPQTTVAADDGDGGIDIPASVFIIAGTLVAAGAMGLAALRIRARTAY